MTIFRPSTATARPRSDGFQWDAPAHYTHRVVAIRPELGSTALQRQWTQSSTSVVLRIRWWFRGRQIGTVSKSRIAADHVYLGAGASQGISEWGSIGSRSEIE